LAAVIPILAIGIASAIALFDLAYIYCAFHDAPGQKARGTPHLIRKQALALAKAICGLQPHRNLCHQTMLFYLCGSHGFTRELSQMSNAYDPQQLAVLQAAFEELWAEFQHQSSDLSRAREQIAKVVMEVADTGELDPDRIVIEARYNVRKLFSKV
jgi:hypothetical protein